MNRFVSLAGCHFARPFGSYEDLVKLYLTYDRLGIYNFYGNDKSSLNEVNCKEVGPGACGTVSFGEVLRGYGESVNSFMYFAQIGLAGQFQEPQSL